jgi:hypothetical protein
MPGDARVTAIIASTHAKPAPNRGRRRVGMGAGLSPQRNDVDVCTERRNEYRADDGGKPAPTMRDGCRGGFPRRAKCPSCPARPAPRRLSHQRTRNPPRRGRRRVGMGAGLSPRRDDVDISPDRRDGHHAFDAEKPAPTMRGMGCAGVRCATGVGAGFPAMRFNPHARRCPRHGDHRINARETRPPSRPVARRDGGGFVAATE